MPDPNPTLPVAAPAPAAAAADLDLTDETEAAAAAARVQAEVDAVRDEELEPINRNLAEIAATVLGANRKIQEHLPALATLTGIDIERIRKLGDYAQALAYWNSGTTYATTPKPEVIALVERGIVVRERILHDLGSFARHGLFDESLLANFGETTAYVKVGNDLLGLAKLVKEHWAALSGKSFITLAAMNDASALGMSILQAVGDRELDEAQKARDVVRRNKAYSLVVRAYDEVRDGLAFLRRAEGDAERIAPSILAFRGTIPRKKPDAAAPGATTPQGGVGSASDVLGPKTSSLIVPDTGV